MENCVDVGKAQVFRAILKTLEMYKDGLDKEELDDLKQEIELQLAIIETNKILGNET